MSEPCRSLDRALGGPRGVVCAVGAGGKKTALHRLAREIAGRIALTATVHTPPPGDVADLAIVDPDPLARLRELVSAGWRVVALGRPSGIRNRWTGLRPDEVDALAQSGAFSAVLVKADGARMRWVKAPGPDEPVYPATTAWALPVCSLRAVGRPLDGRVAHRPDRLAAVTGAVPGEPLRPDHLARWLAHPEGALKGTGAARVVPILNMADDEGLRELGHRIAEAALATTTRFHRVVVASLASEPPALDVVTRTALAEPTDAP